MPPRYDDKPQTGARTLARSQRRGGASLYGISRFLKYSLIGGATFAFDLLLLAFLKESLGFHYLLSAAVAFAVAVSINYVISRSVVFKGTLRPFRSGYLIFAGVAGISLVAVTILMAICVEALGFDYLFARLMVACVVGLWSYLMNLFVNFKVAGRR
jgi:putative flippase GtrA